MGVAVALDDVRRVVQDKDREKRIHPILHDMYVRDGAERPAHADFKEKFLQRLTESGLDSADVDTLTEAIVGELAAEGTDYKGNPEEFAKKFLQAEDWQPPASLVEIDGFLVDASGNRYLPDKTTPVFLHSGYPGQGVYYDQGNRLYQHGQPYVAAVRAAFTEVDGFLRDQAGNTFLRDRTTAVFLHSGYPGQDVYYDQGNRLYQHGQPYVAAVQATFTEVDGFLKDQIGNMFLKDRTTPVFPHSGYPGKKIYYDRENKLYQNGQPYPPVPEPEPDGDLGIAALFNDPAGYDVLTQAYDKKELAFEVIDEDIDLTSLGPDYFINAE